MGAIPKGQVPQYLKLRRKLKGPGTRVFQCGCVQEKDEDVFVMSNGSARCNVHRWARVKCIRVVCAKCGKTADLDPRGANAKYCTDCAKRLYPRRATETPKVVDPFTPADIEYLKGHHDFETLGEMAKNLGIPVIKVSAKCKELGLKTKHPWTYRKEVSINKFFAAAIPRVMGRLQEEGR